MITDKGGKQGELQAGKTRTGAFPEGRNGQQLQMLYSGDSVKWQRPADDTEVTEDLGDSTFSRMEKYGTTVEWTLHEMKFGSKRERNGRGKKWD